jgi:hypothetical protein
MFSRARSGLGKALSIGFGLDLGLAWLYVALRVAHSLVHATVNVIVLRWAIFMAASVVLRAAFTIFA